MRFIVEAIIGLALILMAQNTVIKAHNWLWGEVVRHIVEREPNSMVRFTEAPIHGPGMRNQTNSITYPLEFK